jgi:hypothetical protein
MAIDIIVHHWSIVFRKLREYQGAAEHANIIVRTYYAKKSAKSKVLVTQQPRE